MSSGKSTNAADHMGLAAMIAKPFAMRENCPVMDSEAFAMVMLHFVKCRRTYDPEKSLFTSYAGNMAFKSLRREFARRAIRATKLSYGLEDWQVGSSRERVDADVDTADQMEEVREAMKQLDDRQREIVERRLKGQSFREIGSAMKCSGTWVESLYGKAVDRLREIIAA